MLKMRWEITNPIIIHSHFLFFAFRLVGVSLLPPIRSLQLLHQPIRAHIWLAVIRFSCGWLCCVYRLVDRLFEASSFISCPGGQNRSEGPGYVLAHIQIEPKYRSDLLRRNCIRQVVLCVIWLFLNAYGSHRQIEEIYILYRIGFFVSFVVIVTVALVQLHRFAQVAFFDETVQYDFALLRWSCE